MEGQGNVETESKWVGILREQECHRSDLTWCEDPHTSTPGCTSQCSSLWGNRQGHKVVVVEVEVFVRI